MSETATISQDPMQALGDVASAAGGVVAPGTGVPESRTRNERGQFQGKKSDAEVRAIMESEFPDEFKKTSMGQEPKVQPAAGDVPAVDAKEEPKESEAPPDRELAKADAFLTSRAKVSPAVLSKLDADGRKALAKELKESVVERQRLTQQLADMQKASPTPQVAQEERGSPTPPSFAPLKEAMKGIADLYGEEAAAPLAKAFDALASRQDAMEQHFKLQESTATQDRVTEAREALQERFPQYEDDDSYQEALGVAAMFESGGRGTSKTLAGTKALLEKAAHEMGWKPVGVHKPNKDQTDIALLQSNGTASSRTKPGNRPALTKDEKAEAAARFALDPTVTVEEARRRIASM